MISLFQYMVVCTTGTFLSFFKESGLKVGSKLSTFLPSTCCPGKTKGNISSSHTETTFLHSLHTDGDIRTTVTVYQLFTAINVLLFPHQHNLGIPYNCLVYYAKCY